MSTVLPVAVTTTATAEDVVRFPAASRAVAVSMWEPLDVALAVHVVEYGEAVTSAPRFAPSSRNWTPATPMLSEALAETVIVPVTEEPLNGLVIETVGGVVSDGVSDSVLLAVTITAAEVVRFPAASRAIAV